MTTSRVWCLLISRDNGTVGRTLKVPIEDDTIDIADLKSKVKEAAKPRLDNVLPFDLFLWRSEQQKLLVRYGARKLVKMVKEINLDDDTQMLELGDNVTVKSLGLVGLDLMDEEALVVEVPGTMRPATSNDSKLSSVDSKQRNSKMGRPVPQIDNEPSHERPRKKARMNWTFREAHEGLKELVPDSPKSQDILSFYNDFWGVPLPEGHKTLNEHVRESLKDTDAGNHNKEEEEENEDDLLPEGLSDNNEKTLPLIQSSYINLLIRAEYLRIYAYVASAFDEKKKKRAIVLTGQPGIGKTYWIHYVLRRRIGDREPVILYEETEALLFCSKGVFIVPNDHSFGFPSTMWMLVDSEHASPFPPKLNGARCSIFPIYVASPDQERRSKLHQSWHMSTAIMNPWTKAEIKYAAEKLYPEKNLSTILERYDDLGPTARVCLEFDEGRVAACRKERRCIIRSEPKLLFQRLLFNRNTPPIPIAPHNISLIRRLHQKKVNDPEYTVTTTSQTVANMLASRVEELGEAEVLDMWRAFSRLTDARGLTGVIWEAYVHRRFRSRIEVEATYMHRKSYANARWQVSFNSGTCQDELATITLCIEGPTSIVYEGKIEVNPGTYYIPKKENAPGLDSFILHENLVYIFQCAGGKGHAINEKMIDFLDSCSGIPSSSAWRFIFVLPDDLSSFSCPASKNPEIHNLKLYTARIPV